LRAEEIGVLLTALMIPALTERIRAEVTGKLTVKAN
jgi:hypothetical protein